MLQSPYALPYNTLFANQRSDDAGMAAAFADWAAQAGRSKTLTTGDVLSNFGDQYANPTIARFGAEGQPASARFGIEGFGGAPRFTDPFAGMMGNTDFSTITGGNVGGMAGSTGIAALDAHNAEINRAAQQYGAPANLIKAMINRESSGNWERDGWRVTYLPERNDLILPFVGITKAAADAWGLNWNAMVGNKQAQIDGMARILSGLSQQYGGYDNAIKVYFGGEAALRGDWRDENNLSSNYYYNQATQNWHQWDQQAGFSGGGGSFGQYGDGGQGSNIVSQALSFVGVPYVWGSLPSADQDPWQTGWDCSAFVNWLDDKYGANELPAGSHYQYQDTINKGLLVRDPNQLQAGDLVFFDTGNTAGGGSYLNRAGHVGMYIGNGQFIQAANPGAGTIVSNLADYMGMYTFLGGRKMQWSGGGGGYGPSMGGSGASPVTNFMQQYLFRRAA